MRLLFLSQAKKIEDQPDFHRSFLKVLGAANYRNLPYKSPYATGGWNAVVKAILEANEDFQPNVVFFQFFHSTDGEHPRSLVRALKDSHNHPMIAGSLGDPFNTGVFSVFGRPLPPSITELANEADVFFSTSMGRVADALVRKGGKNIVFLPHAYCPEHFPIKADHAEKMCDVLMIGSVMRLLSRHPLATVPTALKRSYVVKQLSRQFGDKFALYGNGWAVQSARGYTPFKNQVSLFRSSKVVVDSPPRIPEELYLSDRPYFIAGAPSSLVLPYTPRAELLFTPDVHAYFVHRLRDTASVCKKVLALPDDVRMERELKTYEYIHSRNHVFHRVDTILSAIEAILAYRSGAITHEEMLNGIRFWHFRPELPKEEFLPFAVANLKG